MPSTIKYIFTSFAFNITQFVSHSTDIQQVLWHIYSTWMTATLYYDQHRTGDNIPKKYFSLKFAEILEASVSGLWMKWEINCFWV